MPDRIALSWDQVDAICLYMSMVGQLVLFALLNEIRRVYLIPLTPG